MSTRFMRRKPTRFSRGFLQVLTSSCVLFYPSFLRRAQDQVRHTPTTALSKLVTCSFQGRISIIFWKYSRSRVQIGQKGQIGQIGSPHPNGHDRPIIVASAGQAWPCAKKPCFLKEKRQPQPPQPRQTAPPRWLRWLGLRFRSLLHAI